MSLPRGLNNMLLFLINQNLNLWDPDWQCLPMFKKQQNKTKLKVLAHCFVSFCLIIFYSNKQSDCITETRGVSGARGLSSRWKKQWCGSDGQLGGSKNEWTINDTYQQTTVEKTLCVCVRARECVFFDRVDGALCWCYTPELFIALLQRCVNTYGVSVLFFSIITNFWLVHMWSTPCPT